MSVLEQQLKDNADGLKLITGELERRDEMLRIARMQLEASML